MENLNLVRETALKGKKALELFLSYSQEQIDHIVAEIAKTCIQKREVWAEMAYAETQLGLYEDKIKKNFLAAEMTYNFLRDKKTVGKIREDKNSYDLAEPVGVIAAYLPCTNPTATVIHKALTAIKTRNPIIFSPHPRSVRCSYTAAQDIYMRALEAGAPKDCIQCFESISMHLAGELMKDENIDMIWATGGKALVKAVFSSGKPGYAGGSGNVPSYIEKTADIEAAVFNILFDKMFDYSATCTSTKGVVVDREIYAEAERLFNYYNCHILTPDETVKLTQFLIDRQTGMLDKCFVAISAQDIAQRIGISIKKETKVLIVPLPHINPKSEFQPIEAETITSVLKLYIGNNIEECAQLSQRLISYGGIGHTANIYSSNKLAIEYFSKHVAAGRVNINMPSTLGAASDVYTDRIPTFTIACGTFGNNMTTDNLNYAHFLNIKRVAAPRSNLQPFRAPAEIISNVSCREYFGTHQEKNRKVMVVTDEGISRLEYFKDIVAALKNAYQDVCVFNKAIPDPTIEVIMAGISEARVFKPDTIIAIGGGSSIDCAKVMRVCYDIPSIQIMDLCLPFMDIGKKLLRVEKSAIKTRLICIPTTVGTGSETTCAAVITDTQSSVKYPIFDFNLLFADTVILDGELVQTLPKKLVAETGIDALIHAIEAYVSIASRPETDAMALRAIKTILSNIELACDGNPAARTRMLIAASDAGIAITNAFVGINHSLGHQLGGVYHLAHGASLAVFFRHVVHYNSLMPYKLNGLPTYNSFQADKKYAAIGRYVGISGESDEIVIFKLVERVDAIMKRIGISTQVSDYKSISQTDYDSKIQTMAKNALLDICTLSNPRDVLLADLVELYKKAYANSADTIELRLIEAEPIQIS